MSLVDSVCVVCIVSEANEAPEGNVRVGFQPRKIFEDVVHVDISGPVRTLSKAFQFNGSFAVPQSTPNIDILAFMMGFQLDFEGVPWLDACELAHLREDVGIVQL